LERLASILNHLVIKDANAAKNIEIFNENIASQEIMNIKIKEGKSRKESHDFSQTMSK